MPEEARASSCARCGDLPQASPTSRTAHDVDDAGARRRTPGPVVDDDDNVTPFLSQQGWSSSDAQQICAAFAALDTDGSGTLDAHKFITALRCDGRRPMQYWVSALCRGGDRSCGRLCARVCQKAASLLV